YIADAISSALNQSYSNIEYIISDDCSTDHTFSIIQKACNLSKKNIKILKNEVNVGLVNHLNNCLKYASGDLIVLAAGDDIAILDRVKRTVDYFLEFEDVNILSFNDTKIINGKKTDDKLLNLNKDAIYTLNDYITGNSAIFPGASRAFRREVFDIFGNLLSDCPTEDTPYLLRGLMTGKALISCKPGIHYRLHDSNLSSHSNLIKMNFLALQNQFEVDLKT